MRYLVGFVCVVALAAMGCETTGTPGDGGSGGDGGSAGVGGGGVGGDGGSAGVGGGGVGGDGGSGGAMPECESAEDCDDQNECTDDACDPSSSSCEHAPVPDGRRCGGENYLGDPNGGCYAGLCNFLPVSVAIGEKEVVFDWSAEHCEDLDVPDGPAKVVRAEHGELVLFDSNAPTYYVSRGADFDAFERVCDPPALVSADLRTPKSYENWEWLWSIYRDGPTWHAFIHNEFHDAVAPTCKVGDPSTQNPCWYNSITYAMSTDGARSFVKPGAPGHVVAPAPRIWTPPDAPVQDYYVDGYFEPTNIVLGPDDYYYALMKKMRIDPTKGIDERGVCAMRTTTLDDPASWRAWDGSGFNLPLTSPYVAGGDVSECESVETTSGGARGLTYNTYLERYMLVDEHFSWETGEPVCGFTFSTSLDLIHWSEHQLITPARIGCDTDDTTPDQLEPVRTYYPSIVDHEDSTINFERPGRTPYLYYTRSNEGFWLDRDLVRVPLTFTLEE